MSGNECCSNPKIETQGTSTCDKSDTTRCADPRDAIIELFSRLLDLQPSILKIETLAAKLEEVSTLAQNVNNSVGQVFNVFNGRLIAVEKEVKAIVETSTCKTASIDCAGQQQAAAA